ncbi:hypothetical protein QR680_018935 [Steinernema hermaphroditum]|uniref:PAP-associated domain-containing protein n=1 Tax=Steinernema hermaphroditum TaxID=289476 RepID=A0AA39HKT4_9BILA|nr:hypothetical protein QR680_018935 [Steinernema hermaphroditum]
MNATRREWYGQRLHVTMVPKEQSIRVFSQVDSYKQRFPEKMAALDEQIAHYCLQNQEGSQERAVKRRVRDELRKTVRKVFPDGLLIPVGSTVTRLCVKRSDFDLCLCVLNEDGVYSDDRQFVHETLQELHDAFMVEKPTMVAFHRYISQTTVPIIRIYLTEEFGDMEVDINCNVIAQFYSNHLVRHYVLFDERVQPLIMAIKSWASNAGILDSQKGRLNSFSFVMMAIHFLQSVCSPPIVPNLNGLFPHVFKPFINIKCISGPHHLCIPSKFELEPNDRSPAELLLAFIAYFAEFNWDQHAIVIREGRLITRQYTIEESVFEMYIEEPYDRFNTTRTVKSSQDRDDIVRIFDRMVKGIFEDGSIDITELLSRKA